MRLTISLILISIAFLLPTFTGRAQTACPIGTAAGAATCGPSPETGGGSVQEAPRPRAVPTGEWESQWGSIWIDEATASVGTSEGLTSKSAAIQQAKTICASDGSKGCKDITTYSNQCVSLAWPSIEDKAIATGLGATQEVAISRSVANCNKYGGQCRSVYSACSKPIFHKY
ncbi:DUF4189 domain-containing protein [Xanthomonas pisi]|uniref:DUF4189 domain-containing protein n=1 Tax=Xanthomonas pisi TaxID=56457 RepID=A0A2S7D5B7_9XANT|nr:DUF4189 domain-containing protein [Xanthomonas pisi]